MSKLKIEQLSIRTSTNDGVYGVDIPFDDGLNIIHAENTHGKSTCIQSLIFALGLEGCLGPSRKVPLKTALTTQLRKANGSMATIFESKIFLQLSNGSERITVLRSSMVEKAKLVSVYRSSTIKEVLEEKCTSKDYFLRDEGSATRERGFHCFLVDFIGITLPKVMKFSGSESSLYLESAFSINYVEQTRGWGGILNILPTYLGIKDLSARIIEHTLDLEVQKHTKRKQALHQKKKDAERIWNVAVENLISTAKSCNGFVSNELDDKISKSSHVTNGSYLYVHNDNEQNSYKDRIEHLKFELQLLKARTSHNKVDEKKVAVLEEQLSQYTQLLAEQEKAITFLISDLNTSEKYTSSIELRINDVKDSLRKYKDLVRLESIGSEEEFQTDLNKCPTCHTYIEDSLLSHIQSEHTKILGLSDNIKYLEKQKEAFDALLSGEKKNTTLKQMRLAEARGKLGETRQLIRAIKDSLVDTQAAPSRIDIKRELIAENEIEKLESALQDELRIKDKLTVALCDWLTADSALAAIPHSGFSTNDWKKLKTLKYSFVENLDEFGYSSNSLSDFEISHTSYKPTLNDIDINSEASASDNIRVIWSYLYSVLTLDVKSSLPTNHLGLLIMDEPRQQEAKNESFSTFISKAASVKNMQKQIIIGTSEKYSDLLDTIERKPVNLMHFDSDIIKKLS
ncbi:hypothetical protein TUM4438_43350 [Shewanella sairae]|uniref:Rad50/SbcC-type AAA domain-containing protein n=1 Tax=Shewanella sairae TaxID=190310 RepID=A0ABQ4PR65_9GAMM|nr:hypothetical protein [Shewanella sairae]MCL1131648.1 hypothetical protein [Shewanella sairae]GIU51959.1 hypothetical protein TUM4438_43350 [Shewanella sairae]